VATLYLLPCPIAEGSELSVLPVQAIAIAQRLTYFLAENAKTAKGKVNKPPLRPFLHPPCTFLFPRMNTDTHGSN